MISKIIIYVGKTSLFPCIHFWTFFALQAPAITCFYPRKHELTDVVSFGHNVQKYAVYPGLFKSSENKTNSYIFRAHAVQSACF